MVQKKHLILITALVLLLALLIALPRLHRSVVQTLAQCAEKAKNEKQYKKAATFYQHVLFLDSGNTDALLKLARVYMQSGKSTKALELLEKAVKINPRLPDAHFAIGEIKVHQRHPDEATAEFKKALELKPDLDEARLHIASILYKQKKYTEAIEILKEPTLVHKRNGACFIALYFCLTELGRNDEAFTVLEKSLEMQKPPQQALPIFIDTYERKKETEKIDPTLDKFLAAYADDFDITRVIASYYFNRKRYDQAEKVFRDAAARFKTNEQASLNLGYFYFSRKRFDDALKAVEPAVLLQPNSAEVYNLLGYIQVERGDYAKAEEELKRSLAVREKQASTLNALAWLYVTAPRNSPQYRTKEGVELARKALTLSPDDASILDTLARALYADGKFHDSISYYTLNVSRKANRAYAWYGLAVNYFRLNDPVKGRKYLKMGIDAGFSDDKLITNDSDIPEIRNDKYFKKLLEEKARTRVTQEKTGEQAEKEEKTQKK